MTYPTPTRADHLKFCRREGWTEVRNSRGTTVGHHATFELALPDGRVLRTRISRPPHRQEYGPRLWAHILRDQLCVSETEFWDCVSRRVIPDRGQTIAAGEGLPVDLVHQLIHRVGLTETQVATMTRKEAADRMTRFWMTGE